MSTPYLTLTDDLDNVYTFPTSFWLRDISWSMVKSLKKLAYASGGQNVGDQSINPRSITIEGALRADTRASLETLERSFHNAIVKGGKLKVSDDTVSRYIDVRYPTVQMSYSGDYLLEKLISVTFEAEYPFWQDTIETDDINVMVGNGNFTVDNSGSDYIVLPIITIGADQAVDVPSVRLLNLTDGSMVFEYIDVNFLIGSSLVINSKEGTVELDSNDVMENVTEARFLRLQNAVNTFSYEGNACTITVTFRKVYF